MEIQIAPDLKDIKVTETAITTEWQGGITYELGEKQMQDLRRWRRDEELKLAFQAAIGFASKPWQVANSLNNYFNTKGTIL